MKGGGHLEIIRGFETGIYKGGDELLMVCFKD
jgi:hypothetical protein